MASFRDLVHKFMFIFISLDLHFGMDGFIDEWWSIHVVGLMKVNVRERPTFLLYM